jgi:hypothetical protein
MSSTLATIGKARRWPLLRLILTLGVYGCLFAVGFALRLALLVSIEAILLLGNLYREVRRPYRVEIKTDRLNVHYSWGSRNIACSSKRLTIRDGLLSPAVALDCAQGRGRWVRLPVRGRELGTLVSSLRHEGILVNDERLA